MEKIKFILTNLMGLIGGLIFQVYGGWDNALTTLLCFVMLDYITGVIVATFYKNSLKSTNGGFNSSIGIKGIFKKIMIFVFVAIAYRLDILLDSNFVMTSSVIAFIINELLSIIQNSSLMGFDVPKVFTKAIDMLKEKMEVK